MLFKLAAFKNFISKSNNNELNKFLREYSYLYFPDEIDNKFEIVQNINNSKVIAINHYKDQSVESDELYFIIGFRKTILIVNQSLLHELQPFFLNKDKLKICFLKDTKNIFDEKINIQYEESEKNEFFSEEVTVISQECFNNYSKQFKYDEFLNSIKQCISGYLIQHSYLDLNYDRSKEFYSKTKNEIIQRKMEEKDLIELRIIGIGSSFQTILYYHISDEKLYAIKKPRTNDNETQMLLNREISNYEKIKHPYIPKYYGTVIIKNEVCLVIEFINGQTLSAIKCSQFSISERIMIIKQLLSVINYLHKEKFIYRDMKPNNVLIDQNKTIVVIDFDRMIEDKNIKNESNNPQTVDFCSTFHAPEINDKSITNKCDIYSFGRMINEIIPDMKNNQCFSIIYSIYLKCIEKTPTTRPSTSVLLFLIFIVIENMNITIDLLPDFDINDTESQYKIGIVYYSGQYISQDINKSIYYFSLAANNNYPEAQYILGSIYYIGQNISKDIDKSIYYFSLAANNNYPKALYILGLINYSGQYFPRDINKSIHYLTLAANQNYPNAQNYLGKIYYEGQYIPSDINKSIYYYSLAAKQNILEAQFNLGVIYYIGQYIPRDINKSIYYYSLAAKQNDPEAQFILGFIYHIGQYISRDINKSIYYYSLAANQNHIKAQFNLGLIYEDGQYLPRDINKSIYYYSLAAKHNDPDAQFNLGVLYEKGKYLPRDINKSIYYYSLAAKQNDPEAQFNLGLIYYTGQYIPQDINKSMFYFLLAANQNHIKAQFNLGFIYYTGQYIPQDINKSMFYFLLAANQNDPQAQFQLGVIYYTGQYIPRDINKSIYYYSLAVKQNDPQAQYNLGLIYYLGKYITQDIKQDIKRGIFLITQSSNNDYIPAHFALGFLYQEGKYVKRNIDKSIKYYKKASSFNNQYAKNNLGIIYKNNVEKKYDYTVYFEEAIQQKNDPVSMYNLSHAYIYEYQDEELINKSIELLIKSSIQVFMPSIELLCLILLKNFFDKQTNDIKLNIFINISNIEQKLSKFKEITNELKYTIIYIIHKYQLYDQSAFENFYHKYEEIEFIYDMLLHHVCIKDLYNEENEIKLDMCNGLFNIASDFYEGFGHDIYK